MNNILYIDHIVALLVRKLFVRCAMVESNKNEQSETNCLDRREQSDAGREGGEVQQVRRDPVVFVHLRYQVRGGDVEEVSSGERHEKGDVDLCRGPVGEDASQQKRE